MVFDLDVEERVRRLKREFMHMQFYECVWEVVRMFTRMVGVLVGILHEDG
ncbi:hypothetical protein J7J18_06160 [bacterium]|nr:hypothetical protein [bacterium]